MDKKAFLTMKNARKTLKSLNKSGLFSVILALGLYILWREVKNSPSLPSLTKIAKAGADIFSSPKFYTNLSYTLKIVAIGIAVSFVGGVIVSILCSMVDWLNDLVMPIINSTKNIPSIALFPLFIVLMGIGDTPRIFVIVWNSVYPIISCTFVGLNSPDQDVIDAAQNCGASKWQVYRHVRIPLAVLDMLNGLKVSVGNGFIAIVVAEMLGATKGLGYMVLWSANAFRYAEMYIYILVIALIGFLFNVVIDKIIKTTEKEIYYGRKKSSSNDAGSKPFHYRFSRLCQEEGTGSDESSGSPENEVCRLEGI